MASKSNSFQPNWLSHPGKTVQSVLENRKWSISDFARMTNKSTEFINDLISGLVSIDDSLAKLLEAHLGSSSRFWVSRQHKFDKQKEILSKSISQWAKMVPLSYIEAKLQIQSTSSRLERCLEYFDVQSYSEWKQKYDFDLAGVYFKKSPVFQESHINIATWLRLGEIDAKNNNAGPWNKAKFIRSLEEVKNLTRVKNINVFIPKLIDICAKSGVTLSIHKTPPKCPVSGASRIWLNEIPIIQLSFRYLSEDSFWFTFFHEAAHLILHSHQNLFIDAEINSNNEKEIEANIFAQELLFPGKKIDALLKLNGNVKNILRFALDSGVSPGIVVGQMQYHGIIKNNYLNSLKRRYNWDQINEAINLYQPPK